MNFRTEFKAVPSIIRLSAHRNLLFFGSCFSDNICRKMRNFLWPAVNPSGVLYNPASIAGFLDILMQTIESPKYYEVYYDGLYHNMLLDSSFSSVNSREMYEKFISVKRDVCKRMEEGADLVITFGTAFVYTFENLERLHNYEANNERIQPFIVGNCHKLPSSDFSRRMLSVKEIVVLWENIIRKIRKYYPTTRIIFTISPVRHIKDGFEGNSLSKAVLRLALDEIVKGMDPAYVSYFPAYEILNDDLRDYRFYGSDLIHPSEMAVDYIFNLFQETYIPEDDRLLARRGLELTRGFQHRPIVSNPKVEAVRQANLKKKYEMLRKEWPECLMSLQ